MTPLGSRAGSMLTDAGMFHIIQCVLPLSVSRRSIARLLVPSGMPLQEMGGDWFPGLAFVWDTLKQSRIPFTLVPLMVTLNGPPAVPPAPIDPPAPLPPIPA